MFLNKNNRQLRVASLEDLTQIQVLFQKHLATLEHNQAYYYKSCDILDANFIKHTIENKEAEFLVIEEEQKLIGFALIYIENTLPYECFVPRRYVNFADLFIEEDYRCQGLGRAIIKEVKTWAKKQKADYIELFVQEQNPKAYQLYLKEAFEPVHTVMRLKL